MLDETANVGDAASVRSYLTHLAIQQRVSASTQNQAFCAILFLRREVLGIDIDGVGDTTRARRGKGDKDRTTLLADAVRDDLRAQAPERKNG